MHGPGDPDPVARPPHQPLPPQIAFAHGPDLVLVPPLVDGAEGGQHLQASLPTPPPWTGRSRSRRWGAGRDRRREGPSPAAERPGHLSDHRRQVRGPGPGATHRTVAAGPLRRRRPRRRRRRGESGGSRCGRARYRRSRCRRAGGGTVRGMAWPFGRLVGWVLFGFGVGKNDMRHRERVDCRLGHERYVTSPPRVDNFLARPPDNSS